MQASLICSISNSERNLGILLPNFGSFNLAAGFLGIKPSSCVHLNIDLMQRTLCPKLDGFK